MIGIRLALGAYDALVEGDGGLPTWTDPVTGTYTRLPGAQWDLRRHPRHYAPRGAEALAVEAALIWVDCDSRGPLPCAGGWMDQAKKWQELAILALREVTEMRRHRAKRGRT